MVSSANNNDHIYTKDSNKIYKLTSDGALELEASIGKSEYMKAINVGEYRKINVFNTQLNIIKIILAKEWIYNYIVDKM